MHGSRRLVPELAGGREAGEHDSNFPASSWTRPRSLAVVRAAYVIHEYQHRVLQVRATTYAIGRG